MAAAPTAKAGGHIAGILDEELGGFPRILTATGPRANRSAERSRRPATTCCPANDVQAFVASMVKKDYSERWRPS
jgi:hypothetical protein